ncbi:MAG TPA: Hsp20/alpha crystallin family protein [Bordetella sp.]|jgi:HSP20 family protein|nr:Hsp20/alpha crystallin family protein [Bordetella sp.]
MNRLFPGADIFQELERIQQQFFGSRDGLPASLRAARYGAFPPVNVGSTHDSVEVVAFIPGMKKEEIEVTIDNGILTICGERHRPEREASNEIRAYAQERFAGTFRRAIELPPGVDPTQATARYENGCLVISVGKQEASKPRAISIA